MYVVKALHERMVADGTRGLVSFMGPNGDADVAGVEVYARPCVAASETRTTPSLCFARSLSESCA